MNLIESLPQAQQNQEQQRVQQDRPTAISYLEKSLQQATDGISINDSGDQLITYLDLNLSLALELIATKQPELLKRAKGLTQKVAIALQENPLAKNLLAFSQLSARLQYVQAVLELESGKLQDVLPHLQSACQGYADSVGDIAVLDDIYGYYYLRSNDFGAALSSFERSLAARLETNQTEVIGKSYANLGEWYLTVAEISQAGQLFQTALDIALTAGDYNLRLQALKGLVRVAIAELRYADAITIINDVIPQLQAPVHTIDLGHWYCDLSEALLGLDKVEESLICMRINVLPRFREFHYQKGMAIARQLRGKIYMRRMLEGLDVIDEDAIETAEDSLLDAAFSFEQMGMMLDYAKSLYDIACLYQLSSGSQFYYQYQGKSLRSLELALSILEQIGLGQHLLAQKADQMLMQVLQNKF